MIGIVVLLDWEVNVNFKIYDFNNAEKIIELPDKEIKTIFVTILSGDETGYVAFADGSIIEFDASSCRFMNFYDGSYVVMGEDIDRWINYVPTTNRTISYKRRGEFS